MKGIYQIRNVVTGKCYIGSSKHIEQRWEEHRTELSLGRHVTRPLQNAWDKYGETSFVFEVLQELSDETTVEELTGWETEWLELRWPTGYNINRFGGRPPGFIGPHTRESKDRISQSLLNRSKGSRKLKGPRPESVKEKLRRALRGRRHSVESREKMRESNRRDPSPEHIENRRQGLLRYWEHRRRNKVE